ncbi:aldo/keto reductase [Kurthia sibirica]|uniref:Aldo/keto reductase n=1 Tax=Kurthia sibirica TaxID=202750 RepID=A0A2U3AH61_9BACL|nr:aldo/keto reductase [Kurthia sibirica]PWI23888.1 aldo/keto reductase [Kurthia sibirica]GEK35036.1 glyoxal reductase [Kurthia sibirica]
MNTNLQNTTILNNGVAIPNIGLGVFQVPNEETAASVSTAIKLGYRHIDTAAIYGNEEGVGTGVANALRENNLSREELFITSKVWNDQLGFEETIAAFEESLQKLQLDYLDLYLIHWPGTDSFQDTWLAMESLYRSGKIKAIGVCNFDVSHLQQLMSFATIKPAINQIELHPKLQQHAVREFAQTHNIQIEAWAPLMQGGLFEHETLLAIAKNHQKTVAQIIIRWHIENGIIAIPKSTKEARMIENAAIFDFDLTADDLTTIHALNEDQRVGPNPMTFNF